MSVDLVRYRVAKRGSQTVGLGDDQELEPGGRGSSCSEALYEVPVDALVRCFESRHQHGRRDRWEMCNRYRLQAAPRPKKIARQDLCVCREFGDLCALNGAAPESCMGWQNEEDQYGIDRAQRATV